MRIRHCTFDLLLRFGRWSHGYTPLLGRRPRHLSFGNKQYAPISAIYVITDRPGAVQIWSTANPRMKLGNLKNISNQPLRVVFALPTTLDSLKIEAEAHRTLEHVRNGNWFSVSEAEASAAIEAAAERLRRQSSRYSGAIHCFRKALSVFARSPVVSGK